MYKLRLMALLILTKECVFHGVEIFSLYLNLYLNLGTLFIALNVYHWSQKCFCDKFS